MLGNVLLWVLGGWEILLIAAIILVFFGGKRIPELARGLGKGIREFKDASKAEKKKEENDEEKEEPKRIEN